MKIIVKDIWVRLGGLDVLRGVKLEVGEGISAVLIGRNGAGKTTTIKTIMGIIKPRMGDVIIRIDGREYNVRKLKPYHIARLGVGYVPQGRIIFPDLTVEENLEVARGGSLPEELKNWIYSIMPDLGRIKDRLSRYLSGGECQMLAIARGLVRQPKILLLDEPLEGLAPKVVNSIIKALKSIKESGVSLLITESGNLRRVQELVEVAYGIDRGEIVYSGDVEGILKDEIARQRIWGI